MLRKRIPSYVQKIIIITLQYFDQIKRVYVFRTVFYENIQRTYIYTGRFQTFLIFWSFSSITGTIVGVGVFYEISV